eukprot:Skav206750  [mRNA]  locus=scaffold1022:168245:169510:+ [translate_table: standard]
MLISREFCGILLLAATGICVTGDMVTSKLIEESKWPYWYLVCAACTVASFFNGVAVRCFGMELPKKGDLKWVIARSLLEDLHWYFAVVAVIIGASPGDVAALTSIDIIAAACFGLIFLGEKLNVKHFLALGFWMAYTHLLRFSVFLGYDGFTIEPLNIFFSKGSISHQGLSVAGALCISQPEFLFGRPEGQHHSPLGCWMALLSGCFQAGSFVCARKSAHISVGVLTFTSLLLAVPMALIPPMLPMGHQESWEPVLEEPWIALGLLAVISGWTMSSVALPAAGATRCPAAVSATVFTSACMVSGYLAQMLFFQEMPQALTLSGAACMLLSVILMAIPSRAEPEPEPPKADAENAVEQPAESETTADANSGDADETESLGSFVASEVSFCSSKVRRRAKHFPKAQALAERIGAAFPVVTMSG